MPAYAEAEGAATIETFTVLHDRDGAPHHGVVILRTSDGRRALGRVPGSDEETIAMLKHTDRTPIGTRGDPVFGRSQDPVPQRLRNGAVDSGRPSEIRVQYAQPRDAAKLRYRHGVEIVESRTIVSRADDWWTAWRQLYL